MFKHLVHVCTKIQHVNEQIGCTKSPQANVFRREKDTAKSKVVCTDHLAQNALILYDDLSNSHPHLLQGQGVHCTSVTHTVHVAKVAKRHKYVLRNFNNYIIK